MYSITVRLLTKHHLKFLSLKGGCTGLSESVDTCQDASLSESHVAATASDDTFCDIFLGFQK